MRYLKDKKIEIWERKPESERGFTERKNAEERRANDTLIGSYWAHYGNAMLDEEQIFSSSFQSKRGSFTITNPGFDITSDYYIKHNGEYWTIDDVDYLEDRPRSDIRIYAHRRSDHY